MKNNMNYELYPTEQFSNFKEMIAKRVLAHPDRVAVCYTENKVDKSVTFKEHAENINALGTAIASLGLTHSHIAMVGENCYEWILTQITVLGSDNVYIPVDKELPLKDLLNVINHSDAELVFCTGSFAKCLYDNKDKMPKVKQFIVYRPKDELPEGFSDASDFIEKGRRLLQNGDTSYTSIVPADDGIAEIVYTSGTTGAPKGVMLTKHNLVSSVYNALRVMTVFTKSLSILPYNHTYESTCDLLVSQHKGATICINENLKTVASNFVKYKPDFVMMVPLFVENFYKKIIKNIEKQGKTESFKKAVALSSALRKIGIDLRPKLFKDIRDVFGGNLIMIVCGGAPIRGEIGDFFDAIGIHIINGYGITECSPLLSCNRARYNDPRSVGVKLPCVDIRIEEPNADGEGEIVVKGDIVMKGYYKEPEKTAEVLSDDGWFATGDYGKIVNDRLYLTGRKKNLIVLKNGKNVFPEEIEEYITGIENVEEAVVYSIKDDDGSEVALCAEIYPDQIFAAGKSKEELEKLFSAEIDKVTVALPGYKHISKVKIRNIEFPKTTSRKIRRIGLGQERNSEE